MKRMNSSQDVAATGLVEVDSGVGVTFSLPVEAAPQGDISALAARLDAIEYDTGWRNITSRMSVTPTAGSLYLRRTGKTVWVHAYGLSFSTSASFHTLTGLIPSGFTPPRITDVPMARRNSGDAAGAFRVNNDGTSYFYQVTASLLIWGIGSWVTQDATPATLPGAPA